MNYTECKELISDHLTEFPEKTRMRYSGIANTLALFPNFSLVKQSKSTFGEDIHAIQWGRGPIRILAWSLMHGNETTAFRSMGQIAHLFRYVDSLQYLSEMITIVYIPILNPDGASIFTRRNRLGIDINRDARADHTVEMQFLKSIVSEFKPEYALNLHDQRSIFGIGNNRAGVRLALCIPSISQHHPNRISLEQNRIRLRSKANFIFTNVNKSEIELWSKFDESYYPKALGEWMQEAGISTLLLESGVSGLDYNRDLSVLDLSAFLLSYLFVLAENKLDVLELQEWNLPDNRPVLRDVILRNCIFHNENQSMMSDMAFQYSEFIENSQLKYKLIIDDIGDLSNLNGRQEFRDISILAEKTLLIGHDVPDFIISELYLNGLQEL